MKTVVVKTYKDLIVWQKSMDLVIAVYKLASNFPKEEIYSLTSQIKRCSVSIPSNIAEGRARNSRKEYSRFLAIAYASGAELETQLKIASRLFFGNKVDYIEVNRLLTEVMKILNKTISTLTPNP